MTAGTKYLLGFAVSVCLALSLLASACASNQDGTNPSPPEQAEKKIVDLPPIEDPEKGNPKLDSALWQLIEAEKRGEAELLARQGNIELVDGSVWVIIESVPGQVEAAARVATNAGAKQAQVGKLGSAANWVKALVPVTSLTALADEESILFIRLPWRSSEEGESEAE